MSPAATAAAWAVALTVAGTGHALTVAAITKASLTVHNSQPVHCR